MYFLETNYTRVHRGVIKKSSKVQTKAKENKTCKNLEAGDNACISNSNANEVKESVESSVCVSKNHCSSEVSVSYRRSSSSSRFINLNVLLQPIVNEFVEDLFSHVSFFLNIDEIGFDNTDPATDTNVKNLSNINIGVHNTEEDYTEDIDKNVKTAKVKKSSAWSLFKHKIAKPFKFLSLKH